MTHPLLRFNQEVEHAIEAKKPIVALESNLISQGLPYPENIQTALALEEIIREQGAVPATITLFEGKICIGIDPDTMHYLATHDIITASRRDIAYTLSQNLTASTSISGTLFCANRAGLPLLITGGIGGVHHHVNESFDISADLIELSSTPITVICSGAKSILDLPKTLEMLETQGVPVIGYQTDDFPAFFSHSSGIPLLHRVDTPNDIAKLMRYQRSLQLTHGLIVANPIPKSAEIPDDQIMPIIKQAQKESQHLNGKAITPFLLNRIAELTAGQSLHANIELIKNNAKLGASIAIEYQKIKKIS